MPLLEKWNPFRELGLADRRLRRFFQELTPATTPAADVYELPDEVVVELEVPGFDETQIEIEVRDHTLAVTGEREESRVQKVQGLRVRERLEPRFERRFELPVEIDDEHVTAEYAKGVLTVHVPKTPRRQPRKVAITQG